MSSQMTVLDTPLRYLSSNINCGYGRDCGTTAQLKKLWSKTQSKKLRPSVVLKPRKFSISTMESICSKNVCFWIALAPNRHFLMRVFIMQSAVHCRSNSHEIYLTIIWMILSIRSFFKKVNQTS